MPKPLVILATPCFGGVVTQPYMMSVLQLTHRAAAEGVDIDVFVIGGDALISRARSQLVAHFLQNERATHLLFVDADISFHPEQVFRLIRFDKDFVAGMYPLKHVDWAKLPIRMLAGEPLDAAGLSYVGRLCAEPEVDQGFASADYAGTGFQLIKRGVFERMIRAYPELQFSAVDVTSNNKAPAQHLHALFECIIDPKTRTYLSEDYSFCRRWRAIGGEIWLDLHSRLTHSGVQHFVGNTAFRFASMAEGDTAADETPAVLDCGAPLPEADVAIDESGKNERQAA